VTDGRCDFLPGAALRATGTTLAGEVDRWAEYLTWAAEGDIRPSSPTP